MIGAVNQLRSLHRALRADLSGSVSPYRQGTTVLTRLLTLIVLWALALHQAAAILLELVLAARTPHPS